MKNAESAQVTQSSLDSNGVWYSWFCPEGSINAQNSLGFWVFILSKIWDLNDREREVGGLVVDNSPDSVAKLSEADFWYISWGKVPLWWFEVHKYPRLDPVLIHETMVHNIKTWIQIVNKCCQEISWQQRFEVHKYPTLNPTLIHKNLDPQYQNFSMLDPKYCREIFRQQRFEVHKYPKLDSAGLVNLCRGDGLSPRLPLSRYLVFKRPHNVLSDSLPEVWRRWSSLRAIRQVTRANNKIRLARGNLHRPRFRLLPNFHFAAD